MCQTDRWLGYGDDTDVSHNDDDDTDDDEDGKRAGSADLLNGLAEMPRNVVQIGAPIGGGATADVHQIIFVDPKHPHVVQACAGDREFVIKRLSGVRRLKPIR